MTEPLWVRDAVFYQIFPERFANGDPSNDPPGVADWERDLPTRENFFGGDLAGISAHSDHLTRVGATALYTTPIFAALSNHKYDTTDYLRIEPAFGTLDTFHELVRTLHDRGIRLVLDAVFNHCGDSFWAFQDVIANGRQSPYWDWFYVGGHPIQSDPPNYQTCGGAPFLPKLNTWNLEVQKYLLDVAAYWIEQGADGWRLDVPWKADMALWPKMRERVLNLKPDAYLVSEVWRGTSDWLDGTRVHGVMNYRLRANILDYAIFDHMDAEDFAYELDYLLREYGDTAYYHLNLLGSHDTPRLLTLSRRNVQRAVIAITLQLTLPGTPMIYYGDEIGMEGENDPDCRRPMIWDERRWNPAIWQTTTRLTAARHAHPALRSLHVEPLKLWNGVFAYARRAGDDVVLVITNPRGVQPCLEIPVPERVDVPRWRDVLSDTVFPAANGHLRFEPLPAQSAFVLVPESGSADG
jgi:glycosidase